MGRLDKVNKKINKKIGKKRKLPKGEGGVMEKQKVLGTQRDRGKRMGLMQEYVCSTV